MEDQRVADVNPKPNPGAPEEPAQAAAQSEIVLNDRNAHTAYSNFARVTATPEEVIIDFALNPNPFIQGKQEVQVTQRLITNFYTAKRLCRALLATLQRHEAAFGPSNSTCNAAPRGRSSRRACRVRCAKSDRQSAIGYRPSAIARHRVGR